MVRTVMRVVAREQTVAVMVSSQMTPTVTTYQSALPLLMTPISTLIISWTTKQLLLYSTSVTHFCVRLRRSYMFHLGQLRIGLVLSDV